MARFMQSHWWAPSVMGLSFLVGLLLALGHHLFYQSLTNKPTNHTTDYQFFGAHLQSQQLNIAIGTAFAFVIKAALVLAVSVAYYQVFWKYIKTCSGDTELPTLGRLDVAFSGLNDIVSLFTAPVWFQYPLLFLMAVTAWLLPIASIITPATLSVVLREDVISTSLQNVPQIDFSRFAFLEDMSGMWVDSARYPDKAKKWAFNYSGPSRTLQRTALSMVVRNDILPIDSSFTTTNTTWISEFHGPSLNCGPVDHLRAIRIQQNIEQYILEECIDTPLYLSWYPRVWDGKNLYHEPYYRPCLATNATSQIPECVPSDDNADDSTQIKWFASDMAHDGSTPNAMFYVALMPTLYRDWDDIQPNCESDWYNLTVISPAVRNNMTLLQCEMHNSTYRVEFNYTSTAHDIHFDVTERGPKAQMSFASVPLSWLSTKETTSNCTNLSILSAPNRATEVQRCAYDPSLVPKFVYQSILEAFSSWVTGNITYSSGESTQVRRTALFETRDFQYLTPAGLPEDKKEALSVPNLQGTIRSSTSDFLTTSNLSLSDAIQSMFNNYTISLLSQQQFRANYSSPTAPPRSEVTTTSSRTVYAYRADRLWAAYGAAAFCTAISVALGIFAVFASKDTFKNNFSTIFRVSRGAELDVEVEKKDADGMSPLPPYLAAATVRFGGKGEKECDGELVTGKYAGIQSSLLDGEESWASRGRV